MKQYILSWLILGFFLTGCKTQPQHHQHHSDHKAGVVDESAKERIDSLFKKLVADRNVGGISALIYEKDKEVYYNAFGVQNEEKKIPMSRQTIVQIWSMTKPLTGTALMTLYEKGLFNLDDPLSKYFQDFRDMKVFVGMDASGQPIFESAKRQITIRDITRHTAGFANNGSKEYVGPLYREANLLDRNSNLQEMMKKLAKLPLIFHPGEEWSYGVCVDVQAALVEKLSGKPFYEYLKSAVLDPLEMKDTRYYVPAWDQDRLSAVYFRAGEGNITQRPDSQAIAYNTFPYPMTPGGYGLTSTLDDYMNFARMMVHGGELNGKRILKESTVKLMSTNQLDESVTKRMWLPDRGQVGFGIDLAVRLKPPVSAEENNGVVGEFFWDGAASTLFWVDPVNQLTAVMLVQLFPYDQIKLHNKFRDAVYGEYVPGEQK